MMQFQSDLKECVELRGIFHLQFLSLCKGLGFRAFLGFRVLCQGSFFYRLFHYDTQRVSRRILTRNYYYFIIIYCDTWMVPTGYHSSNKLKLLQRFLCRVKPLGLGIP